MMEPEQIAAGKEEFDKVLDKVLASSKYWRFNNKFAKQTESLMEQFEKWLSKLLEQKIQGMENAEEISKVLSVIILIVVGVILIIAVALLIRSIYKRLNDKDKLEEILGEKITRETTPFTLRDKAVAMKQQGDYRMSIRYSYISLLLMLHENGILYIEKAMTNMEIYKYLEKQQYPQLAQFKEIMEFFNYIWYGQNECSITSCKAYEMKVEEVWNGVTANEKA